jgi:hypothetical protein
LQVQGVGGSSFSGPLDEEDEEPLDEEDEELPDEALATSSSTPSSLVLASSFFLL